MAIIVGGNKIAEEILKDVEFKVSNLKRQGFVPRLLVIFVGQYQASLAYIRVKQKKGEEIGVAVDVKSYPEETTTQTLKWQIQDFNSRREVNGTIVQLPLPNHLKAQEVLDAISPDLDVDCLTTTNKQTLIEKGTVRFLPPTPAAIIKILDYYQLDLSKANTLLLGSGDLVGKPLAAMLLHRGVSFQIGNRFTKNLKDLVGEADVIITGVGKPRLITGEMVKAGVIIIDAGTAESEEGALVGDVDLESVAPKARLISPVPGGVGPVTVAILLKNVVDSAFDTWKSKV